MEFMPSMVTLFSSFSINQLSIAIVVAHICCILSDKPSIIGEFISCA